MSVITQTQIDFTALRTSAQARSDFLEGLAKRNDGRVLFVVRQAGGPEYVNLLDEARQAFLLGANRAIDSARTDDDGRGHNDPVAWCTWKGMMAVREVMRGKRGRTDRPSIRQRAESATMYLGEWGQTPDEHKNEAESRFVADPNDYADEAAFNVDFTQFLGKLKPVDRDVALLLAYGKTDEIELTCHCTGETHSYIRDIADAMHVPETRIFKIIRRIRDAARVEFQIA